MARPANCGTKEVYTSEDIANGLGGARGCGGNAPGGRGAGGGRGGAAAGRGAAAANIDPETGQPALAVHYDTAQFGLSGNTIVKATNMRTSILTGPEGKLPPVNAEGQQRQKNIAANRAHQWDGPETRPIGERCLSWPSEGPPMLSTGYNADLQIVQGDVIPRRASGNDPRCPHDPHQRRPGTSFERGATMVRQLARPLGRRQAGRRDHQLHGANPGPEHADQQQAEGDGEVLPHRCQQRFIRIHGRRSRYLGPAVER